MSLVESFRTIKIGLKHKDYRLTRRDLIAGGISAGFTTILIAALGGKSEETQDTEITSFVVNSDVNIREHQLNFNDSHEVIEDRENYQESVKNIEPHIREIFRLGYLEKNGELTLPFKDIEDMSDTELESKIIVRSEDENTQTGYEDGLFTNTGYLIKDEGEVVLTGFINDKKNYSRIEIQIDEDEKLVPWESDAKVKFAGLEVESIIHDIFKTPIFSIPDDGEIFRTGTLSSILIQYRHMLQRISDDAGFFEITTYTADNTGFLTATVEKKFASYKRNGIQEI